MNTKNVIVSYNLFVYTVIEKTYLDYLMYCNYSIRIKSTLTNVTNGTLEIDIIIYYTNTKNSTMPDVNLFLFLKWEGGNSSFAC